VRILKGLREFEEQEPDRAGRGTDAPT